MIPKFLYVKNRYLQYFFYFSMFFKKNLKNLQSAIAKVYFLLYNLYKSGEKWMKVVAKWSKVVD